MAAHTALSASQCLALRPTAPSVAMAAAYGLFVSVIVLHTRRESILSAFVPLVVATIIAVFAAKANTFLVTPISTALATFLPGTALITTAMELIADDLIAEAGAVVLVVVGGLLFVFGVTADAVLPGGPAAPVGWAPWLGAAIFVSTAATYFRWPARHRR